MKNSVSKILKYGALTLFALSIIGSLVLSQKEEVVYVEPEYSFEEGEYETKKTFDGGLFFTSLISSAISCTLIFAFGELIEIQHKSYLKLESISKTNEEEVQS